MASVYGSAYVEGKVQELRYSSTSAFLFFPTLPKLGGVDVKTDGMWVTIYSPSDAVLKSQTTASPSTSATFGLCTIEDHGWLEFDAMTSRFNIGSQVSNASSGFTATLREVRYTTATAGRMYLQDIYQTVADGKTIVDDGDTAGSATTNGTPYAPFCYLELSLTSSTYPVGENYRALIKYEYGGHYYYDNVYFDVVYYPMQPMTDTRMIDDRHPDWLSMRPKNWSSWLPAIHAGHAELCRRIRALGNRPAFIPKREELMPYELAFIEAEIARNFLSFEDDRRKFWLDHAEDVWASRGEFAYAQARSDGMVDSTPIVFSSRLTR